MSGQTVVDPKGYLTVKTGLSFQVSDSTSGQTVVDPKGYLTVKTGL